MSGCPAQFYRLKKELVVNIGLYPNYLKQIFIKKKFEQLNTLQIMANQLKNFWWLVDADRESPGFTHWEKLTMLCSHLKMDALIVVLSA